MKLPSAHFDKEQAAAYDGRFAKLAPMKDSLHLLMRLQFSELPARPRILCVGSGTGAEMAALAREFPEAEFTAVEPSLPMLEVSQERARKEGFFERCTFHNGYVHELPEEEAYDAATSILVSQFLVERADRVAFFQGIAQRLRPGGCLVTADLSANLDSEDARELKELWRRMLVFTGVAEDTAGKFEEGWRRDVAVRPPAEVAAMIAEGGFLKPTLFYQNLFIHAWSTRRAVV